MSSSTEKHMLQLLAKLLQGSVRTVEGDSYRSIFGGALVLGARRFPLMTTRRVALFDIVGALKDDALSTAAARLLECPFDEVTVDLTAPKSRVQFYVMDDVLFAQCYKSLTTSDQFGPDIARLALAHRAVAFRRGLSLGPLKLHFGELRMPLSDEAALRKQLEKVPRHFPELSFRGTATKAALGGNDLLLDGYYPID